MYNFKQSKMPFLQCKNSVHEKLVCYWQINQDFEQINLSLWSLLLCDFCFVSANATPIDHMVLPEDVHYDKNLQHEGS